MAEVKIVRHTFKNLKNGKTYYVRVYPMNPDKKFQSELYGQWASATPKEV